MSVLTKLIVLVLSFSLVIAGTAPALKSYNIDASSATLSGVSAGGYMAVQMHVAFSSIFKGAAIIAGGPFWCANDNLEVALTACMKFPQLISLTELWAITKETAAMNYIDNLSNLQNSKVWIFSGTRDTIVNPGVVLKLQQYYSHYVSNTTGSIKTFFNIAAQHSWVTDSYGNSCAYLGTPYINDCEFDSAGSFLNHLYGDLKPRSRTNHTANFFTFDQSEFALKHPHLIGLDETGYLYVPSACQSGNVTCRLHLAFHGCEQASEQIGDIFATRTGLNEWAETNNIIVVYPQAHSNQMNPKACFDWWGYTGPQYASNLGFQMQVMKHIVNRIMNKN